VTAGDTETGSPAATAYRTSSIRSGRLSGSPPVKIRCGFGALAATHGLALYLIGIGVAWWVHPSRRKAKEAAK